MKIRSSEIVVSAIRKEQYPAEGLPEIALVGRSNVGKSSDLNFYEGTYYVKQTGEKFVGKFDSNGQPKKGVWYSRKGVVIEYLK